MMEQQVLQGGLLAFAIAVMILPIVSSLVSVHVLPFGQIAEIVNKGSISCAASGAVYGMLALTGLSCLYSCVYRSRLRGQYDLEEAPCADCLVHICCETCSLSQEYRELKNRGFDMGIGKLAPLIIFSISLLYD
ncbi:hypothetical protein DITRI_Ditri16bG0033300 [Diplodiscus trichospermus]